MAFVLNMVSYHSADSGTYAFIRVTYPAGSVLTASDGTTTLTAGDTSGAWVFDIPEPSGSYADWTVICTDAATQQTAQRTVRISYHGQSESVLLYYRTIDIYKDGVLTADGFTYTKTYGNTGTFTITNDAVNEILTLYNHYQSGTNATTVFFHSTLAYDLSGINQLTVEIASLVAPTNRPILVGVWSAIPSGETNSASWQGGIFQSVTPSTTPQTITIPLLGVVDTTKTYYIGVGMQGRSGSDATMELTALYAV